MRMSLPCTAKHGSAGGGGYAFRGLPYAAATGNLRWRATNPALRAPSESHRQATLTLDLSIFSYAGATPTRLIQHT
jgi:carboxylesterase type B